MVQVHPSAEVSHHHHHNPQTTSPLTLSSLPAGHSPTVNSTLRNLSNVYREQGQLDKAEELDKLTKQKVRVQKFNRMQIQPIFFAFLNETSPQSISPKNCVLPITDPCCHVTDPCCHLPCRHWTSLNKTECLSCCQRWSLRLRAPSPLPPSPPRASRCRSFTIQCKL